jgi:hypothetical protein
MPNWVYNSLSIKSTNTRDIAKLEEKFDLQNNNFSFQKIIPIPEEENNILDWAIEKWGTKWDASEIKYNKTSDLESICFFATPWSPPLFVLEELARQNPEIEFTLEFEEEQGFGGVLEIKPTGTEVIKEWDIPSSHAELAERNKTCYCEEYDEQYYKDCYTYRATKLLGDQPELIEAVRVLAQDWVGGFDSLLKTASIL